MQAVARQLQHTLQKFLACDCVGELVFCCKAQRDDGSPAVCESRQRAGGVIVNPSPAVKASSKPLPSFFSGSTAVHRASRGAAEVPDADSGPAASFGQPWFASAC